MTYPSCWQMAWWVKGSSWTSQRLRGSRLRTTSASLTMEWPRPTSARSRSPSTVSTRPWALRRHISARRRTSAVTAGWCIIDTHVNAFSRTSLLCMNSWILIAFPLEETAGADSGAPTRLDGSHMCRRMLIALFFLWSACISARPSNDHGHEKHAGAFGEDGHPALRSHGGAVCLLRVVPRRPQVRRCHRREPTISLSCSTSAQKCGFWTFRVKQPDGMMLFNIVFLYNQRRWE